MRRHRFRLRSLMISVAIVAVILGVNGMVERRRKTRQLIFQYELKEYQSATHYHEYKSYIKDFERDDLVGVSRAQADSLIAQYRLMVPYYAQLRAKYKRAAADPWRPVAPDPPFPY